MKNRFISLLLVIVAVAVVSFLGSSFVSSGWTTSRAALTSSILTVIKNGGDLRAVKQVYTNRERNSETFYIAIMDKGLSVNGKVSDRYYKYDVPLSTVLEDIRTIFFLSPNKDTSLLAKLDGIITEYNNTDPFDKLKQGQRDHFENVRIKLPSHYELIKSDMNKISDELVHQNALVNEYLKDSTRSFWVSILALILSLAVGLYQLH